jgi:hypothetical protein
MHVNVLKTLFSQQLILMKTGGRLIYSGQLGQRSSALIEYFEVCYTKILYLNVSINIAAFRIYM